MKKQLHILKGLIILIIIFLVSLLLIEFIYNIKHEPVDTSYMWNIKLNNLKVTDKSNEGKININGSNITLETILYKEKDFYEFTVDINNLGTLDAYLDDYTLDVTSKKDILKYQVTYKDNKLINKGDILPSKETRTIKVKIEYPKQKNKIYESLSIKVSLSIKYISK